MSDKNVLSHSIEVAVDELRRLSKSHVESAACCWDLENKYRNKEE
ncbi:hypothetical protein [Thermosipho sp. (in: thermotogales)]|jgi:hypothetical protein|nr:hypothetical protein [Thermosipho sp. (in: thermotogales)]MBZ4649262.1 hypothetical protein [Thermosipho sp. (in: thermotogales)]